MQWRRINDTDDLHTIDVVGVGCLIVSSRIRIEGTHRKMRLFVAALLDAGCSFFVVIGPFADEIHNLIDDSAVMMNGEDAVTVALEEESPKEIVDFINHHVRLAGLRGIGIAALSNEPVDDVIWRLLGGAHGSPPGGPSWPTPRA